ncbi:ExeA family protein [Thermostilla marina]
MYEAYWQLDCKAFENGTDGRFYFPSASHQAALLKLRYAVESRHGAALLTGAGGTGKTLIADLIRSNLREPAVPVLHVGFPQLPAEELLAYLAIELGAISEDEAGARPAKVVHRIQEFLQENAKEGRHAVLVLDEAHLIDDLRAWDTLRLLLNFHADGKPPLTLLIVGQPALLPFFERHPHWEQLFGVKCLLRPLQPAETREYVVHRLKAAGCPQIPFDDDALETVYSLTHGVPRVINRLCDLALLIGYAEQKTSLTASLVRAVHEELTTVAAD